MSNIKNEVKPFKKVSGGKATFSVIGKLERVFDNTNTEGELYGHALSINYSVLLSNGDEEKEIKKYISLAASNVSVKFFDLTSLEIGETYSFVGDIYQRLDKNLQIWKPVFQVTGIKKIKTYITK